MLFTEHDQNFIRVAKIGNKRRDKRVYVGVFAAEQLSARAHCQGPGPTRRPRQGLLRVTFDKTRSEQIYSALPS